MSRLLNQFGRWLIAFVLALGGLAFRAGAEPARTTGSPRAIWVAARSYPGRPGHCLPEYRRRRALASRKQRAAPGRTWRRPPGCRPFGTTDRLRADRATEPLQDGGRRAELAEEGRRAVRGDGVDPTRPQVVYLFGREVLRSPDGGENWQNLRARYCPGTGRCWIRSIPGPSTGEPAASTRRPTAGAAGSR